MILGLSSCSLFDNEDPIPAFLVLEDPQLITTLDQGEPTHKIKDVWVFDGPEFLGVFPLPSKVPIIIDGTQRDISIFAGVRNNGVNTSALRYPFYRPIEITINPEPQEEITVPLQFSYSNNVKFDFIEDFESNHIFTADPNPDDGDGTPIIQTTDEVIYGDFAGLVYMDTDTNSVERTTISSYNRDNNLGSSTFLELDYKCDIPFLVGYIIQEENLIQREYTVIVDSSEEWNKIYIDLSAFIAPQEVKRYTVQIASAVTPQIEPPVSIYLDNIKLIHF